MSNTVLPELYLAIDKKFYFLYAKFGNGFMKKVQKKKVAHVKAHKVSRKANKYSRGALGAGTAYAILAMLVIGAAGTMMIGSIAPSNKSPQDGQKVIITTNTPEPQKSNLQLYYFPGATFTPTPSPTLPPQPDERRPGGSGGGGGRGGGPGGSSSCFVAGTQILMADNSQKNIEDVKVGDNVMGYDEKTKQLVKQTVLEVESPVRDHFVKVTLADGTVLGMTNEHPLYTTNGWKSISPENTAKENASLKVGTLKTGDKVLKNTGEYVEVVAMEHNAGNVQTYNLKKVSGTNDFFANGVAAHNKGGGGGGGGGSGGGGGAAL